MDDTNPTATEESLDLTDAEMARVESLVVPLALRAARAVFYGGTIYLLLNCQTYLSFSFLAFSFAMAGVGSISSLSRLANAIIVLLIVMALFPKDFALWLLAGAGRLVGAG